MYNITFYSPIQKFCSLIQVQVTDCRCADSQQDEDRNFKFMPSARTHIPSVRSDPFFRVFGGRLVLSLVSDLHFDKRNTTKSLATVRRHCLRVDIDSNNNK